MLQTIQALWDQIRAELRVNELPPIQSSTQALLSAELGPLTAHQQEDLESVERSLDKLDHRVKGEPIQWDDYSEAAHALRGPLNAMIGFSRLILKGVDGPTNEAQNEALETIHAHSRRLLAIFNLLLDALLFYKEDITIQNEPLQAQEALEELSTVGQALAANRHFTFETDIATPIKVISLQTDKKRFKQALSALLAVQGKYMEGGVLTLRAKLGQAALVIQLECQGCQLPESLLDDPAGLLTDEADHTLPYDAHLRIGLAWRILEQLGGQLETQSSAGKCNFTVTFPLV
jgi:signal transduction histidine kinase